MAIFSSVTQLIEFCREPFPGVKRTAIPIFVSETVQCRNAGLQVNFLQSIGRNEINWCISVACQLDGVEMGQRRNLPADQIAEVAVGGRGIAGRAFLQQWCPEQRSAAAQAENCWCVAKRLESATRRPVDFKKGQSPSQSKRRGKEEKVLMMTIGL